MKLETEKLLGTLEVLNENLYQTFFWDVSVRGDFNLWNLMHSEGFIQPAPPEKTIEIWLKEEQTHSIVSRDNYSLDEPDPKKILDEITKARRIEQYQALSQLLKSNVPQLEGLTVKFSKDENHSFCGLMGKTADDRWISLSSTVPQRHQFPHWIAHAPVAEAIAIQPDRESTVSLESSLEDIFRELSPLKLAICYPAGYGYTYDYQVFYAIAPSRETAFNQVLLKAKILEIKMFKNLIASPTDFYNNEARKKQQILVKFLKQHLSNLIIYRIGLYDIDYIYIIGQALTNDWLGVKLFQNYEYNP